MMSGWYRGTILAIGACLVCDGTSGSSVLVKQLYQDLHNGYDTRIRPLLNQSHSINVSVHIYINNIIELDTANQKFSFLVHYAFSWRDEFLSWPPENYSDIRSIRFPHAQIWKPEMLIAKPFDGNRVVGETSDVISVSSSGDCIWTSENIHSIMCEVNIRYYPFDTQTCTFTMYASDYTPQEMELSVGNDDTRLAYKENSQWILHHVTTASSAIGQHLPITIVFMLERRAQFILYTVVAPLCLLSVINVCVFLVPIESGEKGSIAVTIFLSYGVFISTIGAGLPQNSLEVSYFLVYMLLLLVFSVLTLAYTVLESRISAYAGGNVVRLFRPTTAKIQIQPFANDSGASNSDGTDDNHAAKRDTSLTWDFLLRKLDVFFFVFFLFVLALSTSVFFVLMKHGGES